MTVDSMTTTLSLPVIDLGPYLSDPASAAALAECKRAADLLIQFSAFAIRDSRVSEEENGKFLDLIEDYFDQSTALKMEDVRPDLHYQVGATPENTEVPRCAGDLDCVEGVKLLGPNDQPAPFDGADPKWRFFWRIGEQPPTTQFERLNAPPVLPARFPGWEGGMNHWGSLLHESVSVLAEMLALGFGLDKETFKSLSNFGPHLLAPTGSDLKVYGKVGTVLAGFHQDLNFLTIHGKSRFPGLHIWTSQGKKLLVKIPDNCLLVQAGKQMEYLTGGVVQAGFHEVVVIPETLVAMEKQAAMNRPLWRISSTLFFHIASDSMLKPLPLFATADSIKKYPEMFTGEQVRKELGFINLASTAN